ncbi:FecCD family ABC transporter permease [Spirochaeta cellobiosiphila]|uniref:FecCD family ABC transporter permease n=1 Tax=Spirochaeta cellobiosiphila TaxID=504483 RepID=UPI000413C231|nr:iron ABC transporter permease [Spirochaeta cellobiosiphila]
MIKLNHWQISFLLIILILFSSLLSLTIGTADIKAVEVFHIIKEQFNYPLVSKSTTPADIIILNVRAPRIVLALLVGGALAVSGTALQGLFRNPMADPYVLGLSSGAAFGVTVVIICGLSTTVLLQGSAFIGALLTAFFGLSLAQGLSRRGTTTLLLTGMTLSFMLSALISFFMYINRDLVENILFWTFGSFSSSSWMKVCLLLPPVFLGVTGLQLLSKDLNLLTQGEDMAASSGVSVQKVKILIVLLSSLLTASAVALSGIIGFIGLIIPHIMRTLGGPNHRGLLISSFFGGALVALWADGLARVILAPSELPVGIITALIGGPYFLFLLGRGQKR